MSGGTEALLDVVNNGAILEDASALLGCAAWLTIQV